MTIRPVAWLVLAGTILGAGSGFAGDGDTPASPRKKVLVELYTSQGCNSCPSANVFLGELARLGYGPDRIVPVSFHVDYFNTPWVDPYSNKDFSQREAAYNSVLKRTDLYFTPMMMVDGRSPMLGSNRPEAIKAIKIALAEKPGAALKLTTSSADNKQTARVEVKPIAAELASRSVMVGLTLTEGPITTKVPSGENAGSSLVEPFVVRSFAFQQVKFDSMEARTFTFPIKLASDSIPSRCRVSAFVQDWDNGKVYQAESILLAEPKEKAR